MGSPITFTIRKIRSVAPTKTGIICSRRRTTYRPTGGQPTLIWSYTGTLNGFRETSDRRAE